jgi:hypothetical protein
MFFFRFMVNVSVPTLPRETTVRNVRTSTAINLGNRLGIVNQMLVKVSIVIVIVIVIATKLWKVSECTPQLCLDNSRIEIQEIWRKYPWFCLCSTPVEGLVHHSA